MVVILSFITAVVLIKLFWKVSGPNEIMVISGIGEPKTISGGGAFVLPLIQKVQRLTLDIIHAECYFEDYYATLIFSVTALPAARSAAISRLLGSSKERLKSIVTTVIEKGLRDVIYQMPDIDKETLRSMVIEKTHNELKNIGIDLIILDVNKINFDD